VIALVETEDGLYEIDLDEEEVAGHEEGELESRPAPPVSLPRVVTAAESGSTLVAVVDARPPMMVSHDAGRTWRESGRGLPPGRAVAIADDPDLVLYASDDRLYLSRDGARFWQPLPLELPGIRAVAFAND